MSDLDTALAEAILNFHGKSMKGKAKAFSLQLHKLHIAFGPGADRCEIHCKFAHVPRKNGMGH